MCDIIPKGYTDEKVAQLTKEAVQAGFNHFKMKVGADRASDLRRGRIIRSIIDDPQYLPAGQPPRDPKNPDLQGKNAGPIGAVLMIDANQVWDVKEAIEYVSSLSELKPWYACTYLPVYYSSHIHFTWRQGLSRNQRPLMISWDMQRYVRR